MVRIEDENSLGAISEHLMRCSLPGKGMLVAQAPTLKRDSPSMFSEL
jgi:hypothetical protein